jgi:hypothetical protein
VHRNRSKEGVARRATHNPGMASVVASRWPFVELTRRNRSEIGTRECRSRLWSRRILIVCAIGRQWRVSSDGQPPAFKPGAGTKQAGSMMVPGTTSLRRILEEGSATQRKRLTNAVFIAVMATLRVNIGMYGPPRNCKRRRE